MNVNKAIVVGRITKDIELKSLPSGSKVCSFSVATNEYFKDKEGVKQEKVEFHNIVIFGKTAENVAQYMSKGSQIFIEGKLQTRSWEADGIKKYRTEIVALNVQFGARPSDATSKPKTAEPEVDPYSDEDINPEDIPF